MTCASATKHWTVYNAKTRQFLNLSHEEFKVMILDRPLKLVGRFIQVNIRERIWCDGILNSDYFK